MLVLAAPERTVLKRVEPKNKPAANTNQRVGWTFNQAARPEAVLEGVNFPAILVIVKEEKPASNARLLIAHSVIQSIAINPANPRSNATLGTSTYAIWASEIEYDCPRNINGTRNTVKSHRPSRPRLIQGSSDSPGTPAKSFVVPIVAEVATLWVWNFLLLVTVEDLHQIDQEKMGPDHAVRAFSPSGFAAFGRQRFVPRTSVYGQSTKCRP